MHWRARHRRQILIRCPCLKWLKHRVKSKMKHMVKDAHDSYQTITLVNLLSDSWKPRANRLAGSKYLQGRRQLLKKHLLVSMTWWKMTRVTWIAARLWITLSQWMFLITKMSFARISYSASPCKSTILIWPTSGRHSTIIFLRVTFISISSLTRRQVAPHTNFTWKEQSGNWYLLWKLPNVLKSLTSL